MKRQKVTAAPDFRQRFLFLGIITGIFLCRNAI
jgi:hypothetical protein